MDKETDQDPRDVIHPIDAFGLFLLVVLLAVLVPK